MAFSGELVSHRIGYFNVKVKPTPKHILALLWASTHILQMKLLLAVLLIGTVTVFGQLTQEQIDAMATAPAAYQAVPQAPGYATETVMGSVIAILGILLKLYSSWNAKNDAIAQTLIRGIELAGKPEVKAMVREIAAEEGQTTFLHKKVQKVTQTDADQTATNPPADQGTGNTTG